MAYKLYFHPAVLLQKYYNYYVKQNGHCKVLHLLNVSILFFLIHSMVEPFFATEVVDKVQTDMWAKRYKDLRDYAFELPKFGTPTADDEVNIL